MYQLARAYLADWGTQFQADSGVEDSVIALRRRIHTDHALFDAMGGGSSRTRVVEKSFLSMGGYVRPDVRRISSIAGINPLNAYYLEDVVGDPPYELSYPVSSLREGAGWVKWMFL